MSMALFPLLPRDMSKLPTPIPTHGLVISTVLSMLTMAILAICLSELHDTYASRSGTFLKVKLARRIQATKNWAKVPLTRWRMTIDFIWEVCWWTDSCSCDLRRLTRLHICHCNSWAWVGTQFKYGRVRSSNIALPCLLFIYQTPDLLFPCWESGTRNSCNFRLLYN